MSKVIETDTWTFIKFWSIPAIAYLVYLFFNQAVTGLVIIGISIFLALALKPLVRRVNDFFNRRFGTEKKHRNISAVFAYMIVVLVIGAIIGIVGPVVINETSHFFEQLPKTFETTFGGWDGINSFGKSIGIENLQVEITNALSGISNSILGAIGSNFVASVSGIADIAMKIMLVLVMTLLILLEGPTLMAALWHSLGDSEENNKPVAVAKKVVAKMANVISTYVSHQMIVAMIDGLACGILVFLLSLFTDVSPSIAVPMGMIAMVFYMIPMFGQFISAVLITIVLLCSSPLAAAIFVVVYIIYAQIENNAIAPKIQGNALNLPAVAILCAMIIGMYMFGLIGAIVAIPIAGCIKVLVDEFPNIRAAARS
ncbi:AI-2E family transporter [Candidatus Saccharibacteria bacterium]|nr:AI-2E family transporter [Candidatus Saccharibacteria bacterium]